jgi:protein-tyrosine phosphatase
VGSWHIGERPHPGTIQILNQHKIPLRERKRGQQITGDIFRQFDYVIAMDRSNVEDLKKFGTATLLLDEIPDTKTSDVPDPYYDKNFDGVYQLVSQGCARLLDRICLEQGIT